MNKSRQNLRGASFVYAELDESNFSGADLTDADFSYAKLSRAKLAGANLKGAKLSHAVLTDSDLSHANLKESELYDADLFGADLTTAITELARYNKGTVFSDGFNPYKHGMSFTGDDVEADEEYSGRSHASRG